MMAGCLGGGGGGGGDNGDQGGDPTELPAVDLLTDYNNEGWQQQWENELVPAFEEETGISVDVEYSGRSGEQENRLATLIQSGNPPDMNSSTFDQVADIWASDQLATVNEVVDAAEDANGEMIVSPLTVDGDIWQVPHGYYASDFHYREDVYEELGLDVPSSFQGVLDNARAIDNSNLDIRGYGLAGGKVGKSQDEFQVHLAQMGVSSVGLRWKDPDAQNELEIWWPEEEITTLLQYFKDLSQYSPDPTSIGWAAAVQNYASGQFAQQYHLNAYAPGVAVQAGASEIGYNTGVKALPYWEEGGISQGDSWLWAPSPDGYQVFSNGDNTPGAKRFLEYLYGETTERTGSLYSAFPARFLPAYGDVLQSDTFQGYDFWQEGQNQQLLDQLEHVQDTIVADHYGKVPESNINDPVFLFVQRQWFYGEMINRVVTGTSSIQETYEWGREQLESRLEEGRNRFR